MLEIDRDGLDEMDKRILEAIIVKFSGGPVGLSSLRSPSAKNRTRSRRSTSVPHPRWLPTAPRRAGWPPRRVFKLASAPSQAPANRNCFNLQKRCFSKKIKIFHMDNICPMSAVRLSPSLPNGDARNNENDR